MRHKQSILIGCYWYYTLSAINRKCSEHDLVFLLLLSWPDAVLSCLQPTVIPWQILPMPLPLINATKNYRSQVWLMEYQGQLEWQRDFKQLELPWNNAEAPSLNNAYDKWTRELIYSYSKCRASYHTAGGDWHEYPLSWTDPCPCFTLAAFEDMSWWWSTAIAWASRHTEARRGMS